ncbi:MAG TPA: HAD hydrolase-like protein [Gemmataceae bacterium]|nr:HAD hydrolase-like protein [Gemmataceae bacterium]
MKCTQGGREVKAGRGISQPITSDVRSHLYNLRMIVCLFDIDGTLLSSGGAGKAAMEAALAAEFGVPRASDGIPFSGRTDRAIARDLFRLHGIEESAAHWQRFVSEYLRVLPAQLASHQGKVLPGIADLLQSLSQRDDMAVGLLTGNIRDGARIKLGHYDIYHHFAFGGFGDHFFDRDQVAQEALAAVQGHLNEAVDTTTIWVIGDTPLDIRCARSIGARAVAVATGLHSLESLAEERPDLALADLSDPQPLLRLWA